MNSFPRQQSLETVLDKCTQQIITKRERVYISQKRKEVKSMQEFMRNSMISLRVVQSGMEDRELEDSNRITGF